MLSPKRKKKCPAFSISLFKFRVESQPPNTVNFVITINLPYQGLLQSPAEFLKSLQYFNHNLLFFFLLIVNLHLPGRLLGRTAYMPRRMFSELFYSKTPKPSSIPRTRTKNKKFRGLSLVGTFSSKLQHISTTQVLWCKMGTPQFCS